MRKYTTAFVAGLLLFGLSFKSFAIEKTKEEAIVRCIISGQCGLLSIQGIYNGGLVLITPLVVNEKVRISLFLTPQGGLILNCFPVETGFAIALFDHDIDGVIDRVRASNIAGVLLQDKSSNEMSEDEKKAFQDLFDDVLGKLHDVLFPSQKKKPA